MQQSSMIAEAGKEYCTSVLEQGHDWGMERLALILEDKVSEWLNTEARTYIRKLLQSRRSSCCRVEDAKRQKKKNSDGGAKKILLIFAHAKSKLCV
jgi:hypothetical protein